MVQGQYKIRKDGSRHFTDGSHLILWERSSEKQYVWLWKVKESIYQHHPQYSGYTIQCNVMHGPCVYNFHHSLTAHVN